MDTPSIPQKHCTKCGKLLPTTREFFSPSKSKTDGLQSACKSCCANWQRQYRKDNPERTRQTERKRWKTKHRKAWTQQWRQENIVNVRASRRKSYANNSEYIKQWQRDYRKRNPERISQLNREWRANNPEWIEKYSAVKNHARRSRNQKAKGSFTKGDVELQIKGQTNKKSQVICWWCNKPMDEDRTIDHRIPLSKGGTNYPNNIVIVHSRCNTSKGAKMPWEWNGRLL